MTKIVKAAESIGGVVSMGTVNCDDEKELAQEYGIRGFPTIKIFSKGKVVDDYQRGRDARSIVDDLMYRFNQLPDYVKSIKSKEDIEASEKPLVVLFTTKKGTPPLIKSLSLDLKNIKFGVCNNEDVFKSLNIENPPKIALFQADQEHIVYEGALKKKNLYDYFKQYNEKKPPKPVLLEVDQLNDKNYENCNSLCIIGCGSDKNELTQIARKYEKDRLKFYWANTSSKICKKFELTEGSLNLLALKGKKLKYLIAKHATIQNTERFFETLLFGGKLESMEVFPEKDEL